MTPLLLRPNRCEIPLYLFIYSIFLSPQNGCSAVHWSAHPHVFWSVFCLWRRFVIVLIDIVSIPILHGLLFLLDSFD